IVPCLGLLTAVGLLWGRGFGWVELVLLLGMYALTALGITVGFHRLFTHRSFEAGGVTRFILAALRSMAVQSSLFHSFALHLTHRPPPPRPHAPPGQGAALCGLLRGLWHAPLGWMSQPAPPNWRHYVKDLRQDTPVRVASALFPLWVALGLLAPAALGWLLAG